ncbi:hypothetical protein CapIbe_005292 [Capra ibex]
MTLWRALDQHWGTCPPFSKALRFPIAAQPGTSVCFHLSRKRTASLGLTSQPGLQTSLLGKNAILVIFDSHGFSTGSESRRKKKSDS